MVLRNEAIEAARGTIGKTNPIVAAPGPFVEPGDGNGRN